jgi:hypothetical protein
MHEETNWKQLDTVDGWVFGYYKIEFKYNESGYLIDKKIQRDGPINVPATPDSTQIIS